MLVAAEALVPAAAEGVAAVAAEADVTLVNGLAAAQGEAVSTAAAAGLVYERRQVDASQELGEA